MLLLKEREGGEEEAERLLAPSVHVFCIPALIFTQSEAGVLSVPMKRERRCRFFRGVGVEGGRFVAPRAEISVLSPQSRRTSQDIPRPFIIIIIIMDLCAR